MQMYTALSKALPGRTRWTGYMLLCMKVCMVVSVMVVSDLVYGQESSNPMGSSVYVEPTEEHSADIALASLFDAASYVRLPEGAFMRNKDGDVPAHNVVISRAIEIAVHEVTQLQWESVMGYNPSDVVNPFNPVESVSWFEVQAFLDSLNTFKQDPYLYRLPSEAEWEYACLAGTKGSIQVHHVAWYNENSDERPHPIKQLEPNQWGLYDMRGNVWEWVQDWYGLYDPKENVNPLSPGSGRARIIRGGSWWSPEEMTTCSHRGNLAPDYKAIILGFRLVREVESLEGETGR